MWERAIHFMSKCGIRAVTGPLLLPFIPQTEETLCQNHTIHGEWLGRTSRVLTSKCLKDKGQKTGRRRGRRLGPWAQSPKEKKKSSQGNGSVLKVPEIPSWGAELYLQHPCGASSSAFSLPPITPALRDVLDSGES